MLQTHGFKEQHFKRFGSNVEKYDMIAVNSASTVWFGMVIEVINSTTVLVNWIHQVKEGLYAWEKNQSTVDIATIIAAGVHFMPVWEDGEELKFRLTIPKKWFDKIADDENFVLTEQTPLQPKRRPLYCAEDRQFMYENSNILQEWEAIHTSNKM